MDQGTALPPAPAASPEPAVRSLRRGSREPADGRRGPGGGDGRRRGGRRRLHAFAPVKIKR